MAEVEFVGLENVLENLRSLGIQTIGNIVAESQRTAAELENHSAIVAPWTDRTGNARASIYGYADINSETITIYHGIRVDYGIWLEIANGGRFRVIVPSVDKYRGIWLNNLRKTLGK